MPQEDAPAPVPMPLPTSAEAAIEVSVAELFARFQAWQQARAALKAAVRKD